MKLALDLLAGSRGRLLGAALLATLALLCGALLNASGGALLARAAQHPPTLFTLTLLITSVRALGLGRAVFRYVERLVAHDLVLRLLADQRAALYRALMPMGRELLTHTRAGTLLNASGPDVDALQNAYLRVLSPAIACGLVALIAVALLWPLSATLALAVLLLLGVAALAPLGLSGLHTRLANARALEEDALSAGLLERLQASGDLNIGAKLRQLNTELARTEAAQARLNAIATLIRELCAALALLLAVWLIGEQVQSGLLNPYWLPAVALGAYTVFEATVPLATLPTALADLRGTERRLRALLALRPCVTAPAEPQSLPASNDLAFEDIGVNRAGIQGFSLHIPMGARVALIGDSGAGKTTLARLPTRDLDPDAGRVTWGGADLRDLAPGDLLRHTAVLDQDAQLLDGTLRENLLIADPRVPDARLRALLDRLGLGHFDLDAWMGESGARVSGGERQRVALARALLKPSKVLILDEPTAHLDSGTEQQVIEVIQDELRGRTLLLVTHRPAPLVLAERVIRLGGHGARTPHPLRGSPP